MSTIPTVLIVLVFVVPPAAWLCAGWSGRLDRIYGPAQPGPDEPPDRPQPPQYDLAA